MCMTQFMTNFKIASCFYNNTFFKLTKALDNN